MIAIVSVIPISIAGLGIQEGAIVYFLTIAGGNPSALLYLAIFAIR